MPTAFGVKPLAPVFCSGIPRVDALAVIASSKISCESETVWRAQARYLLRGRFKGTFWGGGGGTPYFGTAIFKYAHCTSKPRTQRYCCPFFWSRASLQRLLLRKRQVPNWLFPTAVHCAYFESITWTRYEIMNSDPAFNLGFGCRGFVKLRVRKVPLANLWGSSGLSASWEGQVSGR